LVPEVFEHFEGVTLREEALEATDKAFVTDGLLLVQSQGIFQEEIIRRLRTRKRRGHCTLQLFQHVILPAVGSEGIDPVVLGEMALFVRVQIGKELLHQDLGEVEAAKGLGVVAPLVELLVEADFFVVGDFFETCKRRGIHSR
jgi:hypothetical protein